MASLEMAQRFAGKGITVNVVHPRVTPTGLIKSRRWWMRSGTLAGALPFQSDTDGQSNGLIPNCSLFAVVGAIGRLAAQCFVCSSAFLDCSPTL